MSLIVTLCISVGYKLWVAVCLTLIAAMIHRVVLLTLSIAVPFSLPYLLIVRHGILGTIKVGVLNQSRHECPHVVAVTFEPS